MVGPQKLCGLGAKIIWKVDSDPEGPDLTCHQRGRWAIVWVDYGHKTVVAKPDTQHVLLAFWPEKVRLTEHGTVCKLLSGSSCPSRTSAAPQLAAQDSVCLHSLSKWPPNAPVHSMHREKLTFKRHSRPVMGTAYCRPKSWMWVGGRRKPPLNWNHHCSTATYSMWQIWRLTEMGYGGMLKRYDPNKNVP